MEMRLLGGSDIKIAPLVFGGNVFGWTIDEPASFRLLDVFVDSGFNCIDTADIYSRWKPGNIGGESEAIIGKWLSHKHNRDKVVIASKVGSDMGENRKGLSKTYIIAAIEDSLRRLKTDYIDLYQSHTDDRDTPIEETLEAYQLLIKQGKVRIIGASNFSLDRLEASREIATKYNFPNYQVIQPEYNLYDRSDYETEYEPFVLRTGVSVISYFSLAKGFLSGKYRTEADTAKSVRGGGVKRYLNDKGLMILEVLDSLSQKYNTNPSAISLAWLMARKGITAPIASATSTDQLQQIMQAASIRLEHVDLEALTTASTDQD